MRISEAKYRLILTPAHREALKSSLMASLVVLLGNPEKLLGLLQGKIHEPTERTPEGRAEELEISRQAFLRLTERCITSTLLESKGMGIQCGDISHFLHTLEQGSELVISAEQRHLLSKATEVWARLLIGQVWTLRELYQGYLGFSEKVDWQEVEDTLLCVKKWLFPQLTPGLGHSYGIHQPQVCEEARVAFDIHQVLRGNYRDPSPCSDVSPLVRLEEVVEHGQAQEG